MSDGANRCCWVETTAESVHEMCADSAIFLVEVEWDVDEGTERGHVGLCMRHALAANREHIAK